LVEEPPGVQVKLRMRARVIDANGYWYETFAMVPEGQGWWVAEEALQVPLEPEPYPGVWHLVIDVETDLQVRGYRDRAFTPRRVSYHVLSDTLPSGVQLQVPQAFGELRNEGGPMAGRRAWQYHDCEISLDWAPGPTEALFFDNALVMAEATYDPAYEIRIEGVEELAWGLEERSAFLFYERWHRSRQDGPAELLVTQGPDYKLYALRLRALEEDEITPLCREVRATLGFSE